MGGARPLASCRAAVMLQSDARNIHLCWTRCASACHKLGPAGGDKVPGKWKLNNIYTAVSCATCINNIIVGSFKSYIINTNSSNYAGQLRVRRP